MNQVRRPSQAHGNRRVTRRGSGAIEIEPGVFLLHDLRELVRIRRRIVEREARTSTSALVSWLSWLRELWSRWSSYPLAQPEPATIVLRAVCKSRRTLPR